MGEITYSAIIVVYNKRIRESITCESIKQISGVNVEIIVVDNSETEQGNKSVCADLGYTYISMNGNKGLSKAYNAAIDKCNSDILILLDDDTPVTQEYFDVLNEATVNNKDMDIFAPVVYGQDGVIYSPNEFNFLRNHFISNPNQEVSQENFNAIASCLAIRKRVFDGYRFNETLFVDQIDQYFFCEQRKRNRKFMKLDVEIYQNFYQRDAMLDPDSAWKRVRLRLTDVMRHAKLMGGLKYRLLGFIKDCGLSVQIAKKSKSLSVLLKGMQLSVKLLFEKNL